MEFKAPNDNKVVLRGMENGSNKDLVGVVVTTSMMMISVVTKKRIGVLVLEWYNRSRVMVLVFVNWNLYKKNFVRVFLSKRERFWPWQKAKYLVFLSLCFL